MLPPDSKLARGVELGGAEKPRTSRPRLLASYGKLPLSFEANHGQAPGEVKFLSRGQGYSLFFTPTEAILALAKAHALRRPRPRDSIRGEEFVAEERPAPAVLKFQLVRANPAPQVTGLEQLPGKSNYLVGNDPNQWHTNIPTYARVRYQQVYPGVDLVFYGNQQQLEYDFVLGPGASPAAITLAVEGARKMSVDATGNLVLQLEEGLVTLRKPLIYQPVDGAQREVSGGYVLLERNQVGFQVGAYDARKPLIIDPILGYSTYLGTGGESGRAIAVDSAGNAYVAGDSPGPGFPVVGGSSTGDMFVVKLNPTGSFLLYSTIVGSPTVGSTEFPHDRPVGIGVDSSGNAYVHGRTLAADFPTTPGALQPTKPGFGFNGFLFSLNSSGSGFIYSTYLGGSNFEEAGGIAVDSAGNAYVTGTTFSSDFPTKNPFQAAAGGGAFRSVNAGGAWSAINTGLTSINISTLVVDPSTPATIYAATRDKGVFKSTNSGSTWIASNTGLTSLAIQALAIDPVTPANLYAAGAGVFKSTNNGASWTPMNAGLTNLGIQSLAIDPVNPLRVYAGTFAGGPTTGGIFISADGGSTWTLQNAGLTSAGVRSIADVRSIVVDPTTPSTVYAGTSNDGGVFKSLDSGVNWFPTNTGLSDLEVNALAIDPTAAHVYATTFFGGIFVSINGGGSWSAINSGLPVPSAFSLIVDPNSPATLYAGTNAGVFKSVNNGGNWTASNTGMGSVLIVALAIDPVSSANVFAGSEIFDAYVAKVDPTGALVYSSFLGGRAAEGSGEGGSGIAIDGSGNAYVTGFTTSADYPTLNPAQATLRGIVNVFVTKVNSAGSGLLYSTYLGGTTGEEGNGIAVDSSGNAYVTGITISADFPVQNAFQPASGGGTESGFVAKLNSSGAIVYSTYLGGEVRDNANAIAVDASGNAWITGDTRSQLFPLANPVQLELSCNGQSDAFVTELSPTGSLLFSTYLGGCGGQFTSGQDRGFSIAADPAGEVFVTGFTESSNFPTANALQGTLSGFRNAFITKITQVSATADVAISISSFGPNPVVAGTDLTVNLVVTNNGPNPANGVEVGGRGGGGGAGLDVFSEFLSCTVSQGTCHFNNSVPTQGFISIGTLASGASATATFVIRPLVAGTFPVELDVRTNETDPNLANNKAPVTLTVLPGADLSVTLSDSPHPAVMGGQLTYTAIVTNLGPSPASGVTLTDALPGGVTFFSSNSTLGTCGGSSTVTCAIGALASGAQAIVTIVVTANSTAITDTVTVSGNEADPVPSNNSATVVSTAAERYLVTDFRASVLHVLNLSDNSAVEAPGTGNSSSGVALSPNRRLAFVGNRNSNYVSVIDLTLQKEVRRIRGVTARNLALSADGTRLVVPDLDRNDLVIVDTSTFAIITRVSLQGIIGGSGASNVLGGVVVVGNKAFVSPNNLAPTGSPVAVVDLNRFRADSVSGSGIGFGRNVGGITATPDGLHVLTLRRNPRSLLVIDPVNNVVTQNIALPSPFPSDMAVTPSATDPSQVFGYLADGSGVSVVDLRPGSSTFGQVLPGTTAILSFDTQFSSIAINSDGSRAVAISRAGAAGNNVAVLDTALLRSNPSTAVLSQTRISNANSSLTGVHVGFVDTQPPPTAPTASGFDTNVVNDAPGTVNITGTNFASGALVRIGKMDPIPATLSSSASLQVVVPRNAPAMLGADIIVTNPGSAGPVSAQHQSGILAGQFTIFASPGFHPLNQVVAANFGGNTVSILDLRSKLATEHAVDIGGPLGVAVTSDGQRAYVGSFTGSVVDAVNLGTGSLDSSISLPSNTVGGQLDGIAIAPNPATGNPVAYVALSVQDPITFFTDLQVWMVDANPASGTFNTIIRQIPGGLTDADLPGGPGVTPDGLFAYPNDFFGRILVFDIVNGTVTVLSTTTLGVRRFQTRVHVTPDGQSLLLVSDSGAIKVFDIAGANRTNPTLVTTITGAPPAGLPSLSLDSYQVVGSRLFALDSTPNVNVVEAFNFNRSAPNFSQLGSFVVPGNSFFAGLAVTPDGALLYVPLTDDDAVAAVDANLLASGSPNPLITKFAAGVGAATLGISPVTVPEPDLMLGMNALPSPVGFSNNLTYTLTVTGSRTTATGVTLTDTPPAGVALVSVTGTGCSGATTITCNLGTLAAAATSVVTIVITPNALGSITNTAAVTENEIEFNPADNRASVTTQVVPADVAVAISGSASQVVAGTNFTYTITVTNNGPAVASSVTLTDAAPSGSSLFSVSSTVGVCSGTATVTCNLGAMASGATAVVTLVVTPSVSGILANTAGVTAPEDVNLANNSVTLIVGAAADLAVSVSIGSSNPATSNVTYTVTVTNNGPSTATNVNLTDTLAGSASFVSATSPAGACTISSSANLGCNLGTLAAGASASATIVVQEAGTGWTSNEVHATSDVADPIATNNTAPVQPPASDFSVTVPNGSATVRAGQSASYTVDVSPQFGPFGNPVTLGCSGLPAQASCSFSPGSVTPGGSTTTSILTLSTTAPSSAWLAPMPDRPGHAPFYALAVILPAIALLGLGGKGKRARNKLLSSWLFLAVLLSLAMFQVACGGSSKAFSPPVVKPGTAAGTYTVMVNATSGSLQHSTTITLAVQ